MVVADSDPAPRDPKTHGTSEGIQSPASAIRTTRLRIKKQIPYFLIS